MTTTSANRRSAEATRALLLDTATGMLFEHPGATGLDSIRLADVVARAGRTLGSAYQIWGNGQGQAAFRDELTRHVARLAVTDSTATVAMLRSLPAATTLPDLLAAAGEHYLDLFEREGASWSVGLSLMAAAPYRDDLRAILRDEFAVTLAEYTAVFRDLLDGSGYRMRDGRPVEDLVTALNAVVNGFFLRTRLNPEAVVGVEGREPRRNLLYATLEAVVGALTEAAP